MKIRIPHHGSPKTVLIDDTDRATVDKITLFIQSNGYVAWTKGRVHRKRGYLHRLIMGNPDRRLWVVDHINGNKLDNRRSNLRIIPWSHNNFNQKLRSDNTHGFRGVSLHKPTGRWQARITVNKKRLNLGYYDSPQEAHQRYRQVAEGMALPLRVSPANLRSTPSTKEPT